MSFKNKKLISVFLLIFVLGIIIPLHFALADTESILKEIRDYVLLTAIRIVLSIVFIAIAIPLTILILISTPLIGVAGALLKWVTGPNFTTLSYTNPSNNSIIKAGLDITLPFANMFFILILIVIAIATILRVESYGMKKLLPTLIIIALLVNFTPVICGFIVDFSNIMMNYFLRNPNAPLGWEGMKVPIASIGSLWTGMTGIWDVAKTQYVCRGTNIPCQKDDPFGVQCPQETYQDENGQTTIIEACGYSGEKVKWTDQALEIINNFLGPLLLGVAQIIYSLIAALTLAMFAGLFTLRYIMIWLLVIISPVCFACYVLPLTKGAFKWWWNQFFQWAIIGIVGGFFLFLGTYFMNISGGFLNTTSFQVATEGQTTQIITISPENAFKTIADNVLPKTIPIAFLIIGFLLSIKTSALGAGTITKWAGETYNKYLAPEQFGRAARRWGREKIETVTPQKIGEALRHPIETTKAGLRRVPGVDFVTALNTGYKEMKEQDEKRKAELEEKERKGILTEAEANELKTIRKRIQKPLRSYLKNRLANATDADLKSLSGVLYRYGLSRVPILNRSELADYFKKYGEYGYAINTIQGEAKPYSSITLAEDIVSGNVSGIKAAAWLKEVAVRGDMQDLVNTYKKKYSYTNDHELFNDKNFKNEISNILTVAYNGGEGNKILRMDPRLARTMAGKAGFEGLNEEQAIKKAVAKIKTSDLADMSKDVFVDEAVVKAFAELKGEEFWRAIPRSMPEAINPIMKTLEKIYKEDAGGEKEEFKKICKGFSTAMDQYGTRMRASGWKYPWEKEEEGKEEKPQPLIKSVEKNIRETDEEKKKPPSGPGIYKEEKGKKEPPSGPGIYKSGV
ncbi:MAG TPA: hypothetical protein PLL80_00295 [Candidatus Pacearchaeota archaeon]|nr:hypothetical protein [Candidatus Pacearchaeota archaeon]HOK93970.1 hypothetical protein [Candidatus Pacearchaeota archaeon]HPO75041.1 hypothetical protein [Candidatus Pacearchaeota archaeon]